MSRRYALHINETTLDLIKVLNNGGDVQIEEKSTYFLFNVLPDSTTENCEIKLEDDLYDDNGVSKDDLIFIH